jgi:hypothetical protein
MTTLSHLLAHGMTISLHDLSRYMDIRIPQQRVEIPRSDEDCPVRSAHIRQLQRIRQRGLDKTRRRK